MRYVLMLLLVLGLLVAPGCSDDGDMSEQAEEAVEDTRDAADDAADAAGDAAEDAGDAIEDATD